MATGCTGHWTGLPGVREPRYCPTCGQPLELRQLKDGEPSRHVCTGCGEVLWLDPKVAVGTLIEWNGGLILLKRAIEPGYGKWVFPGGFVDRGETTAGAAIREAREEALIQVGGLVLLGVYSYEGHPVVLISYSARIEEGIPGVGDESLEMRVFAFDAIPYEELAFQSTRDAVTDYVARPRGPAVSA